MFSLYKKIWITIQKSITPIMLYNDSISVRGLWNNKFYLRDLKKLRKIENQISKDWALPGGTVVKNLPACAGDMGSSLGPGRSHMQQSSWACVPQLLSLHSRARKPQLLSPRATTAEARTYGPCSTTREATAVRSPSTAKKNSLRSPQLVKACRQQQRPKAAKNEKK